MITLNIPINAKIRTIGPFPLSASIRTWLINLIAGNNLSIIHNIAMKQGQICPKKDYITISHCDDLSINMEGRLEICPNDPVMQYAKVQDETTNIL